MNRIASILLSSWALAAALPLGAQTLPEPTPAQSALWVTACMACHGTNGKAQGVGRVIGGRPSTELYQALINFKSGQRPGSIMPQIAKGFSDAELAAMAQQFAKFK